MPSLHLPRVYALGEQAAAAERFRQVVEADPEFAGSLEQSGGIVLASWASHDEAIAAARRAVATNAPMPTRSLPWPTCSTRPAAPTGDAALASVPGLEPTDRTPTTPPPPGMVARPWGERRG